MKFKLNFLIKLTYLVVICKIHSSAVAEEKCGEVLVGRPNIIGGKNSIHGAFPWVAVLINNDRDPFGGGTLLTKNKVLSAAHCFQGSNYKLLPRDLKIVLGAHDLNDPFEFGKITVGVKIIEIHDDWNPSTESFDADIALVTLTDDVTFSRYIQPICLIDFGSKVASSEKGFVAGYGISKLKTKVQPHILQYTEIPIQKSNEECFYTKPSLVNLSSNRTFCAGNRDGSGVCAGDSGNGLFVVSDDIYYIRGIVSASLFTTAGCDVHNYAIYTNVLKFRDWIENKLGTTNVKKEIKSPDLRISPFRTIIDDSDDKPFEVSYTVKSNVGDSDVPYIVLYSSNDKSNVEDSDVPFRVIYSSNVGDSVNVNSKINIHVGTFSIA